MTWKKIRIVLILIFLGLILTCILFNSGEEAAFRYAENGSNDAEWLERYQTYLDKYPDGKHVDDAREGIGYVHLRVASRGEAVETAQEYDAKNPNLNKIYIITIADYYGTDRAIKHSWNELLPAERKAGNLYEASIYCIVKEGEHIKVDSKRYDNGREIFGYMVMTDVELRKAKTGHLLFSTSLQGSMPIFPYSINSNTYPVIEGSPAQYFELEAWLDNTVY
jgi:hypothetical protein